MNNAAAGINGSIAREPWMQQLIDHMATPIVAYPIEILRVAGLAAIWGYLRILRVTSKNVTPKRARTHFLTPGDIEASPFLDVKSTHGDLAQLSRQPNQSARRRTSVSIPPEIQLKVRSFAQELIG